MTEKELLDFWTQREIVRVFNDEEGTEFEEWKNGMIIQTPEDFVTQIQLL